MFYVNLTDRIAFVELVAEANQITFRTALRVYVQGGQRQLSLRCRVKGVSGTRQRLNSECDRDDERSSAPVEPSTHDTIASH
ncbi:hypothetical protein EVAR_33190_1 [Eumeta japonica]|uniref:Uncharacterized protein n=1 Tax=Eumeta variegata TaxID=151549 RepID=A0A4C1W4Q4_EUMVA|nr:hypothetical protein EVAR_33190_1 [Eumeta japonica]